MKSEKLQEHDTLQMRVAAHYLLTLRGDEELFMSDTHFELMTEDGTDWEVQTDGKGGVLIGTKEKSYFINSTAEYLKKHQFLGLIDNGDGWVKLRVNN